MCVCVVYVCMHVCIPGARVQYLIGFGIFGGWYKHSHHYIAYQHGQPSRALSNFGSFFPVHSR